MLNIWRLFWSLSVPLRLAAGSLVVVLAMSLYGSFEAWRGRARERAAAERIAELQTEYEAAMRKAAVVEGQLIQNNAELVVARQRLNESNVEVMRLRKLGEVQDAQVRTSRQAVRAVRRGADPAPIVDNDELDRRLRALYPVAGEGGSVVP